MATRSNIKTTADGTRVRYNRTKWCADCKAWVRYNVERNGNWSCDECNGPIICDECGQSMRARHKCGEDD